MRLSRAILFALALLLAGTTSATDRADIGIRLVLVDQCTVDAGERTGAETVEVNCSSGAPYRLESFSGSGSIAAAHVTDSGEDQQKPRLTISF
jgi:hypothetical protein